MTDRLPELLEVANRLDTLVASVDDRVSISVETDLDEAFFVGTPMGLTRLAATLLRAAAGGSATQTVAGLECRWSTYTHNVADQLGPVVVGAECVVESEGDRRKVVDHYRALDGDS